LTITGHNGMLGGPPGMIAGNRMNDILVES